MALTTKSFSGVPHPTRQRYLKRRLRCRQVILTCMDTPGWSIPIGEGDHVVFSEFVLSCLLDIELLQRRRSLVANWLCHTILSAAVRHTTVEKKGQWKRCLCRKGSSEKKCHRSVVAKIVHGFTGLTIPKFVDKAGLGLG